MLLLMKKEGTLLFFLMILITIFGIISIFSSSFVWAEYKFNNSFHFALYQGIFFLAGLVIYFIIQKIDASFLKKHANLILLLTFLLLILVLIPGIGKVRNGSRSWFAIGPFGLQPSELVKIALIIFTSKYLEKNQENISSFKNGLFPILLVIFAFFGLIMLEPDFGSGMVICISLILLIFASGANLSFFCKLGIIGLLGISGLIIVAPYRMKRIVSFLNPWSDPLGSGFQIIQSLYAIGPGGLLGLGLGNSVQKHFYLPEPQTDFIFSIICEEMGVLGIVILGSIFVLMFYLVCRIAYMQKSLFRKYLALGLGIEITFQAILNLCVVVGLIPVTGVTLPFISYGGSSLLISIISVSIICNIAFHTK